jgi:indolepyruvate ferredoxin oxidoreductase
MPGAFTQDADFCLPIERIKRQLAAATGADLRHIVNVTKIATDVLGRSIAGNVVMIGYCYQAGVFPLSAQSIEKAIELNGQEVEINLAAFRLGRLAAHDPESVAKFAVPAEIATDARKLSVSLEEMIARRTEFLTAYQNEAYAAKYRELVERVRAAERPHVTDSDALTEAAARNLFKLMAYKDEYEVARLFTDGSFAKQVDKAFDGKARLEFHLAPPLFSRIDPATGRPKKISFGPWMMNAFGLLAKLRFLRGTALDPFGYTAERRTERRLVEEYETILGELTAGLTPQNHALAVAIAALPEKIRGFGPVKERHLAAAKAEERELLSRWRKGSTAADIPAAAAAAE